MISNAVYDGPQFNMKEDLTEKMIDTINCMNNDSRDDILNLYYTFRNRFIVVLMGKGDLCNKSFFDLHFFNCQKLWFSEFSHISWKHILTQPMYSKVIKLSKMVY